MKKNSSNNKRRNQRNQQNPPQIKTNLVVNHIFRFRSQTDNFREGQTPLHITSASLLSILGSMAVSTTAVHSVASHAKLNSISIWTPYNSATFYGNCSITWTGALINPTFEEVSDSTNSTAVSAHVTGRPPAKSSCGMWHDELTSEELANLHFSQNSIIDINCSFIINDEGASGYANAVTGAVVGRMYWLSLDKANLGTALVVPVSLATIN